MRSVTTFAGGAVAAVIASRLLPPLVAEAVGRMQAASGRDPFEMLAQDHRAILELLTKMEQPSDHPVVERKQLLLRFKRRLAAHALAEEDVVYPLLGEQADRTADARHLYAEHAEMKMDLHALEQMPKDDPQWVDKVRALKDLIAEHARREEEVEFPALRDALDEQATARLSGNVQREKAFVL